MNITPPSDDTRLREPNRVKQQAGETQPVKQLEEIARPPRIEEEREEVPRQPDDQRKRDRRKVNRKPLLDTRSGRERRKGLRRREEQQREQQQQSTDAKPLRGIDLLA